MKTGILLKNLNSGSQILSAKDNEVLLSSENLWNGFLLEHHILSPNEYEQHEVIGHRLMINIGTPVLYETTENGKRTKEVYNFGDFKLLSDKAENSPKWNRELNILVVAISPEFALSIANLDKLQFSVQGKYSDRMISHLAILLMKELRQQRFFGKMYAESLITAFVMHLVCNYQKNSSKPPTILKGKLSSSQIRTVTDFIVANLDMSLTLKNMAALTNLSEFHFSRLFQDTLGISPYQYCLKLKLDRAKILIRNKKDNISVIAAELGFTDHAHFTKMFKNLNGISPKSFQKLY